MKRKPILCKISNLPIFQEDKIVLILLIKDKEYKPISLPIYGTYINGNIEKIENKEYVKQLFEFLNIKNNTKITNSTFKDIKINDKNIKMFIVKRFFFNLLIESNKNKEKINKGSVIKFNNDDTKLQLFNKSLDNSKIIYC